MTCNNDDVAAEDSLERDANLIGVSFAAIRTLISLIFESAGMGTTFAEIDFMSHIASRNHLLDPVSIDQNIYVETVQYVNDEKTVPGLEGNQLATQHIVLAFKNMMSECYCQGRVFCCNGKPSVKRVNVQENTVAINVRNKTVRGFLSFNCIILKFRNRKKYSAFFAIVSQQLSV